MVNAFTIDPCLLRFQLKQALIDVLRIKKNGARHFHNIWLHQIMSQLLLYGYAQHV